MGNPFVWKVVVLSWGKLDALLLDTWKISRCQNQNGCQTQTITTHLLIKKRFCRLLLSYEIHWITCAVRHRMTDDQDQHKHTLSFLKSVLSCSKPQLSFQKIETPRILLSIAVIFGCSSHSITINIKVGLVIFPSFPDKPICYSNSIQQFIQLFPMFFPMFEGRKSMADSLLSMVQKTHCSKTMAIPPNRSWKIALHKTIIDSAQKSYGFFIIAIGTQENPNKNGRNHHGVTEKYHVIAITRQLPKQASTLTSGHRICSRKNACGSAYPVVNVSMFFSNPSVVCVLNLSSCLWKLLWVDI